ncbi:nonribosomal peptide synthase [Aspergillus sclerotialis]|uniref:Nonribosomal peptide synthase n=1 Tax=Aspergillus sclerotialis TaxID=2070753 RepID=A0A3A2ZLN1_9EURO|nr:nonribosomal peptide synthase [Aspergillus sclerotialis]
MEAMTTMQTLSSSGCDTLSDNDRRQLNEWNAVLPESVDHCVHELIHDRCLVQPNAYAVCAWDGTLTYRELNSRSTHLASLLVDRGIGKETFVSICLEKSQWMAVAMLGVMKAGAAFVLLDVVHPPDRLRQIFNDVASPLLLTSATCSRLAAILTTDFLIIEDSIPLDGEEDTVKMVTADVTPDNAMYAVFTSGSTGKPKGAVVSHAAYASSATRLQAPLGLGPQSRVLQFSSYAFDVSISDHLLTLLAGGCICIPSERDRQSNLPGAIVQLSVNWACLTPSVSRTFSPHQVPSLRHLVLTGEAATQVDVDQWATHLNLSGLYGPAECAIGTTVNIDLVQSKSAANIGRPYAAVCWVVDPENHNQLVPIGAEGELLIQGPAISRGYINDSDRTAVSFITSPLWLAQEGHNRSFERMYKTGDLVRYNEDGSLQYLGRKDTQVKVRGQRVELTEVEYHVRDCFQGSRHVVAEVIQFRDWSPKLVVFVCGCDHAESYSGSLEELFIPIEPGFVAQVAELESELEQRLPRYMVPDLILPIARIPMTTTGKTDRRHLRERATNLSSEYLGMYWGGPALPKEEPITAKEKALQDLWWKVLKIPVHKISRQSNWFHDGGDSLLAMRLASQAIDIGLSMTVQDIFRYPRLMDLAKTATLTGVNSSSTESIQAFDLLAENQVARQNIVQRVMSQYKYQEKDIEDIYPCTTTQKTLIMSSSMMGSNHTMAIECRLDPSVDQDRLVRAWDTVVQNNPILRTYVVEDNTGEYLQVVLRDVIPLELSSHPLFEDSSEPNNIWGFNRQLMRLVKYQDRLQMLIHHAIFDGYSISVIFQHLEKAYDGEILHSRPFGPFLRWVQQSDDHVDEFWKRKLAGFQGKTFPPVLSIEHVPMTRSALQPLPINIQQTTDGITIGSKFRLALAIILSLATNTHDVSFGEVVSRRGAPVAGITEMIAPTPTVMPVRVQLKPENTLWTSLKEIQDQSLQAGPFECAEFQHIAGLTPDTAAVCQFQTCLVVQPDPADYIPAMFEDWHQLCEREVFPWGLCFECFLSKGYTQILAFYDERVIDASQARLLQKQFACIFELMDASPNACIGDLATMCSWDKV